VVTASNDGTAAVWSADTSSDGDIPELLLVPGHRKFNSSSFKDPKGLADKLLEPQDPASEFLASHFSEADLKAEDEVELRKTLARVLNEVVAGKPLQGEPALQQPEHGEKRNWKSRHGPSAMINRFLLDNFFGEFWKTNRRTVYDARFSPDGKRIVTADFEMRTATLWDAETGENLGVLPEEEGENQGHGDMVVGAAFSPDGKHVVTASTDGFCRVWDPAKEEHERFLVAMPHKVAVRSAVYSPNGDWILTSAADGVARLWSVPDYQLHAELRGHSETSPEAKFSMDGRYIITSSRDGTVRVYYTGFWDLYRLATQRVTRKLTKREFKTFKIKRPLTKEEKAYYQKQEEENAGPFGDR
jgi:WD40 repeat protein